MPLDQEHLDAVRKDREDKKLKPKFAPGQGGEESAMPDNNHSPFDDPFGSPSNDSFGSPNNDPFGSPSNDPFGSPSNDPFGSPSNDPFGSPSNDPFGSPSGGSPFGQPSNDPFGSPGGPMNGGFQNNQPPQSPQNSQQAQGDKFEKLISTLIDSSLAFFKEFAYSIKVSNLVDWKRGLANACMGGLAIGGITLVFSLFNHSVFPIAIGCLATVGISLVGNYFIKKSDAYQKALLEQETKTEQEETLPQSTEQPMAQSLDDAQPFNTSQEAFNPFDDGQDDTFGIDDIGHFDDDSDSFSDANSDDFFNDDFFNAEPDPEPEIEEVPDSEPLTALATATAADALEDLDKIDPNMISKQFIYESMIKASKQITPEYKDQHDIPDTSDTFNANDAIFSDIFDVLGVDEDDIPHIKKYTESEMVDYIEVERPKKNYSVERFDEELTQILHKGYDGMYGNPKMFSKSEFVGKKMITKIFKGKTPMVSVGDVLLKNKDFYLDSDAKIPLILGIDEEGQEVKLDMEEAESIIVSGKPRSGKSFTVRQMLTQMFYFNSPEDIQLYIADVKGAASDYYKLKGTMPHVKQFTSDAESILAMLEHLVNVEAKRRAKRFGEEGVIKIKDYHEKHPDKKDMPYIYVVIDEMVGLATELKQMESQGGKGTPKYASIYFGYLEKLVTQLPAYGIRLIAVPHRVTNNFIPKTASDNMMFKVAVAADEELVKETLGVSKKDYNYKATNKGDLSVLTNIISPNPFYCRSIVPASTTDESDDLFQFQADFWNHIHSVASPVEPEVESADDDEDMFL